MSITALRKELVWTRVILMLTIGATAYEGMGRVAVQEVLREKIEDQRIYLAGLKSYNDNQIEVVEKHIKANDNKIEQLQNKIMPSALKGHK